MIITEKILKDFLISTRTDRIICDVYHIHPYDDVIQVDVKYIKDKVVQGERVTFSKKSYFDFIIKRRKGNKKNIRKK